MQLSASGVDQQVDPSSGEAVQVLQERLITVFASLGRALADQERSTGFPLSRLELAVLVRLARADGARPRDLAEGEGLDPSTMSRRLAAMEEQGLVRREPDPHDGRAALMHLTDTGRERLQHARRQRVELVTDALHAWSAHDLGELARLLGQLEASLEARAAGGRS